MAPKLRTSVDTACLNEHLFMDFEGARVKVEAWRRDYNENSPHSSLGNLAPEEYAAADESMKADLIPIQEVPKNELQGIYSHG